MKKYILLFIAIACFQFSFGQVNDSLKIKTDSLTKPVPAQETNVRKDTRPLKERIDFGFGSSFWFNATQTYIEVAPVIAYRFPKTLITGLGYRYIYRHERVIGKDLNAYGPNVFARINLLKKVYLWTEYEILHNEYYTQVAGQELTKNTASTDSWFVGLGFVKSVGKRGRGGISFQLLYNILYENDDINPYYSPVTYRIGYFF